MKKRVIINVLLIVFLILGVTNVYAEDRNNNPLLREITIDGKELDGFDEFTSEYVLATEKESVDIKAVTDDPNAKVEIKGNGKLKDGNNDIEIKVTAEDETTTKSYVLHITKGSLASANAYLKSLEVNGYSLIPTFNTKTTEYLITYEGDIKKLDIKAVSESDKAKVEIVNNDNFNSKYHVVSVIVTAENGITKKEYKVTAKKIKAGVNEEDEVEEEEMKKETTETPKAEENTPQEQNKVEENTIETNTNSNDENNEEINTVKNEAQNVNNVESANQKEKENKSNAGIIVTVIIVIALAIGAFVFIKNKNS